MLLSKTYFLKEEKTFHDTSSKLEKKPKDVCWTADKLSPDIKKSGRRS